MSDKNTQETSSRSDPAAIAELDRLRGKIFSSRGGWFPGKGVFNHGHDMLNDLVGEKSYMQIMILNATGKMVDAPIAGWFEAICGCLSWPDPRIWCNQIGALAGAARTSPVAATALGAMAADSKTYGILPIKAGIEFITDAYVKFEAGSTPEDIIDAQVKKNRGRPNITGYIRPIAKGDERIDAMERVAKQLGIETGPHMKLAFELERVLLARFDESMNINGYASAFFADQGFSGEDIYRTLPLVVASGVSACYVDAIEKPADSFLPLRCDDIVYEGKPRRKVPD
jgi:hypothetical protein